MDGLRSNKRLENVFFDIIFRSVPVSMMHEVDFPQSLNVVIGH